MKKKRALSASRDPDNNFMKDDMKEIYLHQDDLVTIKQFMDAFPECHTVMLTCDDSSGIGSIITATLLAVDVNGQKVNVSKIIVDESSW
jgi:hypothetical protein